MAYLSIKGSSLSLCEIVLCIWVMNTKIRFVSSVDKKELVDCYIMLLASVLMEDEVVFTILLFILGPENLILDQLWIYHCVTHWIWGQCAWVWNSQNLFLDPKVRKDNDSCAENLLHEKSAWLVTSLHNDLGEEVWCSHPNISLIQGTGSNVWWIVISIQSYDFYQVYSQIEIDAFIGCFMVSDICLLLSWCLSQY